MQRLGVDAESAIGVHHSQAGFEVYERDDGVHPDTMVKPNLKYNEYLKSKGYDEDENPWHWAANSVETENGVRSGFSMIKLIFQLEFLMKILKRPT